MILRCISLIYCFLYFASFLFLIPAVHNGGTMIQPINHQSWTWVVTALECRLFLSFHFWVFLTSPFFVLLLICSLTWYIPWYIALHFFPELYLWFKQCQFKEILFFYLTYYIADIICEFIGVAQLNSYFSLNSLYSSLLKLYFWFHEEWLEMREAQIGLETLWKSWFMVYLTVGGG